MGLSNELSCEAGSFFHHYNAHRFFSVRGLEALFLHIVTLGCVVCLAPQLFLPVSPHINVGPPTPPDTTCPGPPATTLLRVLFDGCPSLALLPVWMNVSSLTPWSSDFHIARFSGSFGCFFVFKFVVVLLLVV